MSGDLASMNARDSEESTNPHRKEVATLVLKFEHFGVVDEDREASR